MLDRASMLLLSARNTVGRWLSRTPLAGIMTTYTQQQVDAAKEDFLFFYPRALGAGVTPAVAAMIAAGIIGSHEGEDSFDDTVPGDKNRITGQYEARGRSQWHLSRRQLILHNTKIDVWSASSADQRQAMWREITERWSWYQHVWAALLVCSTVQEVVTVLVVKYEQSGSQARDVARRTKLAQGWLDYAQQNGWSIDVPAA